MSEADPTNGAGAKRAHDEDLGWFASHVHRNYRIREPIQFEFGGPFEPPPQMRRHVVVKRTDGKLLRVPVLLPWNSPVPDDDDPSIEKLFDKLA